MKPRPHHTIANFVLVLGCAGFIPQGIPQASAQALVTQTVDKTSVTNTADAKERSLLQAITAAAAWQPTDPRVAKAHEDLADFYSTQGRYADAERVYKKTLELKEDMLGRANPAIIPAIDDLARVNFAQMKYEDSAELIARELRILEREYGDNDPRLVPSLEQTARVLESGGKHAEAEKYLNRAVNIRQSAGPESSDLVPDLSQLARVYAAERNFSGAEGLYERVLKIQLKTVSPNSPALLPALDALAELRLEQHQDAEALLKHTLSIREGSVGPDSADVAKNLDQLAAIYTEQKRFPEAEKAGERALFIWMKELKPGSAELAEKYEEVAELYEALDRPTDAEPLVQQVLTARENQTVASLNTLAAIYVSKQNWSEAEPLYRLSLTLLDKHGLLTSRHPAIYSGSSEENTELLAQTASDYVELLIKLRRKSEARRLEARIRMITGKKPAARRKAS